MGLRVCMFNSINLREIQPILNMLNYLQFSFSVSDVHSAVDTTRFALGSRRARAGAGKATGHIFTSRQWHVKKIRNDKKKVARFPLSMIHVSLLWSCSSLCWTFNMCNLQRLYQKDQRKETHCLMECRGEVVGVGRHVCFTMKWPTLAGNKHFLALTWKPWALRRRWRELLVILQGWPIPQAIASASLHTCAVGNHHRFWNTRPQLWNTFAPEEPSTITHEPHEQHVIPWEPRLPRIAASKPRSP